jgi:mRNA-degrading endonuclease RelE of RelBE toxin-antitoxin system
MPIKVIPSESFNKELRRLAHKYPAILDELETLYQSLQTGEKLGDKIPNVGYETYKVRLKNPSANRGKSGGFRLIYYVYVEETLILLTIYSKTDQENISVKDIQKKIHDELSSLKDNDEDG